MVILVKNPAAAGINLFVALTCAAHGQGSVHVHVVTGQIQANQTLEQDGPSRPSGAQEDEQTGGRTAIRDHIQDRAECGGLVEMTRRHAIQRV